MPFVVLTFTRAASSSPTAFEHRRLSLACPVTRIGRCGGWRPPPPSPDASPLFPPRVLIPSPHPAGRRPPRGPSPLLVRRGGRRRFGPRRAPLGRSAVATRPLGPRAKGRRQGPGARSLVSRLLALDQAAFSIACSAEAPESVEAKPSSLRSSVPGYWM